MRVVALLLLVCGCSVIDARSPPRPLPIRSEIDCTDSYGLPAVDLAFAVAELAAAGYLLVEERDPTTITIGVTPLVVLAVVTAASARHGVEVVRGCRRARALQPQLREELVRRRGARLRAWQLTQAAATAARGGDCATVARLDTDVNAIDEDFHFSVFRADVAIVRCLEQTASPSDAR